MVKVVLDYFLTAVGYDKYIGLGREYGMGDIEPPTKEKMAILKAVAESTGLEVMIGG